MPFHTFLRRQPIHGGAALAAAVLFAMAASPAAASAASPGRVLAGALDGAVERFAAGARNLRPSFALADNDRDERRSRRGDGRRDERGDRRERRRDRADDRRERRRDRAADRRDRREDRHDRRRDRHRDRYDHRRDRRYAYHDDWRRRQYDHYRDHHYRRHYDRGRRHPYGHRHGHGPRRGHGYYCNEHFVFHYYAGYDPYGWRRAYHRGYYAPRGCYTVERIEYRRGRRVLVGAIVCHDRYGYPYIKLGSRYVVRYY